MGKDFAQHLLKIRPRWQGLVLSKERRKASEDTRRNRLKNEVTMKRANNLWNKIISNGNLLQAIDEVNKSHRWCAPNKPNKMVIYVEIHKPEIVVELRKILEEGFEQSPTVPKHRWDKNARKWRDIEEPRLYPDQYIHHALIQVIKPILMRGMDRWTCGSIEGRGAIDGIRILKKWTKHYKPTKWCGEADIRHFYDSIKPIEVFKRMKRLIKDYRTLDLIWRIIKNGIKIGFYTSQWFGNVLLQPLDQLLRDIGIHHSIRYLDNFTMFSNRKRTLTKAIKVIDKWLKSHGMKLKGNHQIFWFKKHPKVETTKTGMTRIRDRLPNALGYRFGRTFILLRKNGLLNIKRICKRFLRKIQDGKFIPVKHCQGLLSILGRLRHCNRVRIYKTYIPNGTQKLAKNIIRKRRKEKLEWSLVLEDAMRMEKSLVQSA